MNKYECNKCHKKMKKENKTFELYDEMVCINCLDDVSLLAQVIYENALEAEATGN